MTDDQFAAWLASPAAIRCALVEANVMVAGSETTRYLANLAYVTSAAATPANTAYLPVIAGGIRFTETLPLDGAPGMAFGDIECVNVGGELDAWFEDVWANRAIAVYIGDPRWPRADFRRIFTGIIEDIDSRRRDRINLKVRDKLARLNTAVSETLLGGTTANSDKLLPLTFGEVHNVTPLLVNPSTLQYQVHAGPIERVIDVRDNGVPVSATVNRATGTFILANKPFGTVTASVQGDMGELGTTWQATVAQLVQRLATGYGTVSERFNVDDIDAANFAAFDAANPYVVGLYLDDRANLLDAATQLGRAAHAQVAMSRDGLLQLHKLQVPPPGTPAVITAADMVQNSLAPIARPAVEGAINLAYCRNWTLQDGLQTAIPEEHKHLYAREWLNVVYHNATVRGNYRLSAQPAQVETLLVAKADAEAEAQQRLSLTSTARTVFRFDGFAPLFTLTLGQAATLVHPRFGLAAGKTGMVTGLSADWLAARIAVEVMV